MGVLKFIYKHEGNYVGVVVFSSKESPLDDIVFASHRVHESFYGDRIEDFKVFVIQNEGKLKGNVALSFILPNTIEEELPYDYFLLSEPLL